MTAPKRYKVVRRRPTAAPRIVTSRPAERVHAVHVASLFRAQRRLSFRIALVAVTMLLGLPALLEFVPDLRLVAVFGVPLVWLFLGLLLYPAMWATGHFYVRHAQRLESEYLQVVEESGQ